LDGFQFNDKTGSVQVRERSKLNSMNSNEVVFYDNMDFKGLAAVSAQEFRHVREGSRRA